MSKEFGKLEALVDVNEPSDHDPQVDRNEAAKLAARWEWARASGLRRAGRASTDVVALEKPLFKVRSSPSAGGGDRANLAKLSRTRQSVMKQCGEQ